MRRLPEIMVALLALLIAGSAAAQKGYPEKTVRLVVGYLAGGGADTAARATAQKLGEVMGATVIVDNRPGAGTNIAAELVAKSAPDGYTLLVGGNANTANMTLYRKPGYDIVKDFAPIMRLTIAPNILVLHPSLPTRSLKEVIAFARARPGQLTYASAGIASSNHFSGAMFTSMAGVDVVHVPYKGGAGAIVDLMAGNVSMYFATMPTGLPHVRSGRLRAIAVTSANRSRAAPEIPTVAESGLPGYENGAWHCLLAPAGTPVEIIARLNAETTRALAQPDVKERLAAQGFDIVTGTPQALADYIRLELVRTARLIKEANIRME